MKTLSVARTRSTPAPLASYFQDIDQTPLLSAAEERELALQIQEGDPEARDHMVRSNLRLVVNIARRYTNTGLDLADLIAEGNLGLLRAVEAFDASMNTRFSTYASFWIKQSIKRAVINTGKPIRIPAYMNELLVKWRRTSSQLQNEFGRPPTQEEVARRMNIGPKKLRIIQKAITIHNAMPQTGSVEGEQPLDDTQMMQGAPPPDTHLQQAEEVRQVLGLLDKLEEREAVVLRLRFGLGHKEPFTLEEIGNRLHMTREGVRQVEKRALAKLAERLQEV
jgi:RNA polymerase primary sigma factor